jgi:hypothetical protein
MKKNLFNSCFSSVFRFKCYQSIRCDGWYVSILYYITMTSFSFDVLDSISNDSMDCSSENLDTSTSSSPTDDEEQ